MNNKKELYHSTQIEKKTGKKPLNSRSPSTLTSQYRPNKRNYIELWSLYDMTQNIFKYKENNLPEGFNSFEIEKGLYFRGSLAISKVRGLIMILPYKIIKTDFRNGRPLYIKLQGYNGEELGITKKVNWGYNDYDPENDAVIIYDTLPLMDGEYLSRFITNRALINDIASTMCKLNINLNVSTKKLVIKVTDERQKEKLMSDLREAFDSDSPYLVINTDILTQQEFGNNSDFNGSEWFNMMRNYDSIRCMMSGIHTMTYGENSADRISAGSLDGQTEQVDIIYESGLYMRKQAFELANQIFGTNITVEPFVKRKESNVKKSIEDGISRNEEGVTNE